MKAARAAWPRRRRRCRNDQLVFLDETGVRTGLCRPFGRSVRGLRAHAVQPLGGWKNVTLVCAVRAGGVVGSMVLQGALDAAAFAAYLKQVLLPALRPGEELVMDNLSVHKTPAVWKLIRQAGIRPLLLPPYSPDLTPIENIFSKVKAAVKAVAADTVEGVYAAFADALTTVTAKDLRGCFAACGIRV